MADLADFVYDLFMGAGANAVWDGIKKIIPAKAFEKLDKLAKENNKEEFKKELEIVFELNQEIKQKLMQLQQNNLDIDSITVNQTHYGSGDNVGRDKIIK